MRNRVTFLLDFGRKFLLGAMGAVALLLPLFAGFVYGPALRAQTAAATRPVFTVASVKPHVWPAGGLDGPRLWLRRSGDRIEWHCAPFQFVLRYAYRIPDFRISGIPLPGIGECYDIDAVAEGAPPDDQLRLMFRSLLEDRFAMKVHWETKEMQVDRLLVAKGGSTLKPAEGVSKVLVNGTKLAPGHAIVHVMGPGEHHLAGSRATMEQLAEALSLAVSQPVVDQTGLTGTFDFDVEFQPEQGLDDPSGSPFIQTAIRKTLGLRLESGKVPVEVLVIDHVGELSEN